MQAGSVSEYLLTLAVVIIVSHRKQFSFAFFMVISVCASLV